jgi:hypothetical protein
MSTTPSNLQYMRRAEVVIGSGGVGIDINQLKIVFRIIKTVVPQPNSATIKIYNLSETNESYIKAITQSEYADIILVCQRYACPFQRLHQECLPLP